MDNEADILELVHWLETTAHNANPTTLAESFIDGIKRTCRKVRHIPDHVGQGRYEVEFFLPVTEVQKAFPLGDDLARLTDWFEAINSSEIQVELIYDQRLGRTFLLRRFHHVPLDQRKQFMQNLVDTEIRGPLQKVLSKRQK